MSNREIIVQRDRVTCLMVKQREGLSYFCGMSIAGKENDGPTLFVYPLWKEEGYVVLNPFVEVGVGFPCKWKSERQFEHNIVPMTIRTRRT